MSEDKELQEPELKDGSDLDELESFVDVADLDELDSASNLEVFGDLGDLADLGGVPDLSEALSAPEESSSEEDTSGDEIPFPDLTADTALPDLNEEIEIRSVDPDPEPEASDIFADSSAEGGQALPDLVEDMLQDFDGVEEAPDISMEDMPDALDDAAESDGEQEDILAALDSGEAEETEELPDALGDSADADLSLDGTLDALDDGADTDLSLDDTLDSLDAGGEADALAEDTDSVSGLPGGLGLEPGTEGDSQEEMPLAADESGGDGIESMLGGILNNLDMNGSLEETVSSEEASGEGADSMADILGLADTPFGDEAEGTDDLQDMLDVSEIMPDEADGEGAAGEKEKKPGIMKKLFGNVITDEIAEEERLAAQKAEEEAAKKAEEDVKAKEEAEAKKAEKKAAKEAAKEEKKKAQEAKKAEKAAKKAEKKAKKEEEEAAAELEVVGKLNKAGVSIIVIATILFLAVEITGTNLFSYQSAKNKAMSYFEMGKFTEAYQEAIGTSMRDKDEESYNKIRVVMKVQQSLNAYQNYDRIQYYPEALDALLRGLKRYDANIEEGMDLEVENDMMSCRKQILTLLQEEFNLSESEAYAIIAMDKEAYQSRVVDIGVKKKTNR